MIVQGVKFDQRERADGSPSYVVDIDGRVGDIILHDGCWFIEWTDYAVSDAAELRCIADFMDQLNANVARVA